MRQAPPGEVGQVGRPADGEHTGAAAHHAEGRLSHRRRPIRGVSDWHGWTRRRAVPARAQGPRLRSRVPAAPAAPARRRSLAPPEQGRASRSGSSPPGRASQRWWWVPLRAKGCRSWPGGWRRRRQPSRGASWPPARRSRSERRPPRAGDEWVAFATGRVDMGCAEAEPGFAASVVATGTTGGSGDAFWANAAPAGGPAVRRRHRSPRRSRPCPGRQAGSATRSRANAAPAGGPAVRRRQRSPRRSAPAPGATGGFGDAFLGERRACRRASRSATASLSASVVIFSAAVVVIAAVVIVMVVVVVDRNRGSRAVVRRRAVRPGHLGRRDVRR